MIFKEKFTILFKVCFVLILTAVEIMITFLIPRYGFSIEAREIYDMMSTKYKYKSSSKSNLNKFEYIYADKDNNQILIEVENKKYNPDYTITLPNGDRLNVMNDFEVMYNGTAMKWHELSSNAEIKYPNLIREIISSGVKPDVFKYTFLYLIINFLATNLMLMDEVKIKKVYKPFLKVKKVDIRTVIMYKGFGVFLLIIIFYNLFSS